MASATPGPGQHVECGKIIIKRRRKRLQPPAVPCSVTVGEPPRAPLDLPLFDEARPIINLPPADDEGIREACPLPEDILTPEGSTGGESSLIHSDFGSPAPSLPSSIADHGRQPITVHEFLQDMTRSKAGRKIRKCGRRNRLGTVKLDAYRADRSEQCRSSPMTPIPPSTSNCRRPIETRTRNDDRDQHTISAYPPWYPRGRVIQSEHLRRKKRFAKSLAQRLFEADVFSSGTVPLTSSRSTDVTPDQSPAHTPCSRRPLQFITSLNLTPSLESRIYGKEQRPRFGKARTAAASSSSGSADSEIQPVLSQVDDSVPPPESESLQDGCPAPSQAVASSSAKPSSRNWNGTATWKRTRGAPAAMLDSGIRAFRTRHADGKQNSAQVPHANPFEYVPLPLVRVETSTGASRVQRNGATAHRPQSCTGSRGRARTHAHASARVSNQFQLMSAEEDHATVVHAKDFSDTIFATAASGMRVVTPLTRTRERG